MKDKKLIIIGIFLIIDFLLCIMGVIINKINNTLEKNFYLNGENKVLVDFGDKYTDAGFNATINNVDYRNSVLVDNNINTDKVGDYEISFSLKYKFYTKKLKRTISVVDNQVPVIRIDCDKDTYVTIKEKFDGCKFEAIDNYDGNLTDKVIVKSNVDTSKKGDYQITYSVTDSNNNTTTELINVHVTKKFEHTYIKVSIKKQKLQYFQKNKVVFETPVTTGRNNSTKIGDFKILNKIRNTYLSGQNYRSFVKYWMAFYGNKYGLHDASWRSKYGTMDYNTNGSHGCINVPLKSIEKLFEMIEVGTPLYISK